MLDALAHEQQLVLLGRCWQVHDAVGDGVYQGACFVRCLRTLLLDRVRLADRRAHHFDARLAAVLVAQRGCKTRGERGKLYWDRVKIGGAC